MKNLKVRIIGILLCLGLVFSLGSCSGIDVKMSDEVITVLQVSATSTVGYLIAKNNPTYVDEMLLWYNSFNTETELIDVQAMFKEGIAKLSILISDDPYLQLQVQNAMTLLEISVNGPQVEEDLGKYKVVVDSFMSGVLAGKMAADQG